MFVSFYGGVAGLAPLAELGLPEGGAPPAYFSPGQVVRARVAAVDPAGRLKLSLKAGKAAAAGAAAAAAAGGEGAAEGANGHGDALGGLQVGAVVGTATVRAVVEAGAKAGGDGAGGGGAGAAEGCGYLLLDIPSAPGVTGVRRGGCGGCRRVGVGVPCCSCAPPLQQRAPWLAVLAGCSSACLLQPAQPCPLPHALHTRAPPPAARLDLRGHLSDHPAGEAALRPLLARKGATLGACSTRLGAAGGGCIGCSQRSCHLPGARWACAGCVRARPWGAPHSKLPSYYCSLLLCHNSLSLLCHCPCAGPLVVLERHEPNTSSAAGRAAGGRGTLIVSRKPSLVRAAQAGQLPRTFEEVGAVRSRCCSLPAWRAPCSGRAARAGPCSLRA